MSATASGPRYPKITVSLIGEDGNGFSIVVRTGIALRRAGVARAEIDRFRADALASDYDHLLATVQEWVNVE